MTLNDKVHNYFNKVEKVLEENSDINLAFFVVDEEVLETEKLYRLFNEYISALVELIYVFVFYDMKQFTEHMNESISQGKTTKNVLVLNVESNNEIDLFCKSNNIICLNDNWKSVG